MNRTLLRVQSLYGEMGKAERKAADWLMEHPGDLPPVTISEFAALCDCSEATVVRLSKRLGLGGYGELKLCLAQAAENKIVSPVITGEDDCFAVFEKVCNDAYLSLERTKKLMDREALSAAARALAEAGRIVWVGLGSSASVAADASDKFLRVGCNTAAYSDTHMQTIAMSYLGPGDVAVGISQSGSSKDIVEDLRIARQRGATTICITGRERTPLSRQSDITLVTDTEEVRHGALGANSHLSRVVVIDALCFHVSYRHAAQINRSASANEDTLADKRVRENEENGRAVSNG